MSRILIVEDEARLATFLEKGLRANGYATKVAPDGESARRLADDREFDLVILDLGLPDIDGLTVLRELRDQGIRLPVIILTARDDLEDKVEGLDAGGDDYVTKPFGLRSSLRGSASVSAAIRRGSRPCWTRETWRSI